MPDGEIENERPVYYRIDKNGNLTNLIFKYQKGWVIPGLARMSKFTFSLYDLNSPIISKKI